MSANIEALVKKHIDRDGWSLAPDGEVASAIRNALTEQAETHAMELRAYEATVQNLEQRIRQIEAQRVPEKVECGCGDIYPASQFMCANCLAAVGAADELRRVDDAQSVPLVGEPVAWYWEIIATGEPDSEKAYIGTPTEAAIVTARESYSYPARPVPLYTKPAESITAAELATLREKAKHVDCMRIALEHMMDMVGEPPEANCSCHLSPPCNDCVDHGGLRDAFSGAYAAIAQGKGE